MEGPLGAGDFNRVGASRVDRVARAGTGSGAKPQRGGVHGRGEDRGRGVKPVSAAALGVGRARPHNGDSGASCWTRHHYLGAPALVGANLKYLVYGRSGQLLGALGWQSAVPHLGCRDRLLGWNAAQRARRLDHVVNSVRFLVLPWVRCRIWRR